MVQLLRVAVPKFRYSPPPLELALPWFSESAIDFLSGYLLAKAMLTGVNPYLPLNELATLWLPEHNITDFTHSTPHPFAIGWLCLPLASLRYEQAAVVWLIFELCCLATAVALFFRVLKLKFNWRYWLLATFLALGWVPVLDDLWLGRRPHSPLDRIGMVRQQKLSMKHWMDAHLRREFQSEC